MAIKTTNDVLIGRIYRNSREKLSTIPIHHYINDPMEGIEGSPVAPCEGCSLRDNDAINISEIDNNITSKRCVLNVEMSRVYSIPKRKSRISVSNINDKRERNRLLLSPFSIRTFMNTTIQQRRMNI